MNCLLLQTFNKPLVFRSLSLLFSKLRTVWRRDCIVVSTLRCVVLVDLVDSLGVVYKGTTNQITCLQTFNQPLIIKSF